MRVPIGLASLLGVRGVLSGFVADGLVAHLFLEGKMLALGVGDRLPFTGESVAALAWLGATLGTFEVNGVHVDSLRQSRRERVSVQTPAASRGHLFVCVSPHPLIVLVASSQVTTDLRK